MSTQITDFNAVQFAHDVIYKVMACGMRTNENEDVKRAVRSSRIDTVAGRKLYGCEKLHYSFRLMQVMNVRAFNVRYSHHGDWLVKLHKFEKVKSQPRNRAKQYPYYTYPTRPEIFQAMNILRHLEYNLDDYETASSVAADLYGILARYVIYTDTDFKAAKWGCVEAVGY